MAGTPFVVEAAGRTHDWEDAMRNVEDPKIRRLREVALFQHCTPKELTRLAGITDQAVLETGQVLCRQGEVATAAFVIP